MLFPFYWMVLTSVKSYGSYNAERVPGFFTLSPTLENYVSAFTAVPLGRYLLNTLLFTVITTAVMVVVSTLAAYAFARLEWKGKNLVFTLFLSMMMIPAELVVITNFATITSWDMRNSFAGLILPSVTSVFYIYFTLFLSMMMIPAELVVITNFATITSWDMRNSFAGLILPSVTSVFYIYLLKENFEQVPDAELVVITNFATITSWDMRNSFAGLILPSVTSVFYIYLLKENFEQVPDELYRAAKVDGTSDLKYLWKVMIPVCRPTLVTITILKMIECWNSYVWPRLITDDPLYGTSDLKYLWKVMIPVCRPTLVTITILKMIECWNSYVWPRLITDDPLYYLVSNGIQEIRENGFGRENIPAMMAAVVVISLPLIVLFLVFRKKIMAGVSRGGIKG